MTATGVDVVTTAEVVSQLYEGIMARSFPAQTPILSLSG